MGATSQGRAVGSVRHYDAAVLLEVIAVGAAVGLASVAGLSYFAGRVQKADIRGLALSSCPSCLEVLGYEAAQRAWDEHQERCEREFETARKSGRKLRIASEWPLDCPHCGAPIRYDPRTRTLKRRR